MNHKTELLVSQFSNLIESVSGNHCTFNRLSGFETAGPETLVFLADLKQFELLKHPYPAVLVTDTEIFKKIPQSYAGLVICVDDVRLAHAQIKQHYTDYLSADSEWPQRHSTALIHPTTTLGQNCRIGPGVVIGADCQIADNVVIRANSVIEHNVRIGSDSIINNLVNIGYDCQLGERVTIQSGCIIGNEGFGFATDADKRHHRIPHTGNVVIADDVSIGSNTCVDRGTYGSTRIGRGVKIDNLCHIAHNVQVGVDCLLTAQTSIAGSSKIGNRVITSGQTGILDHRTVADDAILVQRAGVSQDIVEGGVWAGSPARPFKEFVKSINLVKKVARLELKVKALQTPPPKP